MFETHRLFNCARCHVQVRICTRCDCGHCYCSSECSDAALQRQVLEAGVRYQATEKGRLNHNIRQQRYLERRDRAAEEGCFSEGQEEKMTHKGPLGEADDLPLGPCPEAELLSATSPGREEVNDAEEIEESPQSQEVPSSVVSGPSGAQRCDFCGRLCGQFARLAPIRRRGGASHGRQVGRWECGNRAP